jgi:hypothetical protein
MTNFWFFFIGLLIANLSWFIIFWKDSPYFDYVIPKYITSSYDPNFTHELDSMLLKSLEKYIGKYFTKYNQSIHYNEAVNTTLNELKVTNSSRFSMFLDANGTNIYILKISNEVQAPNSYDSRTGEISLYQTPLYGYRDRNLSDGHNYKVLIKKCWTSYFYGRIIGAVTSNDKAQLGVFYRIIQGHSINYRLRYFHDLSCSNVDIEKSDELLKKEYNDIESKSGDHKGDYYEILETKKDKKDKEEETLSNYFDETSYDDFSIRGNAPISAMAVKKGTIAYARDYDYKSYYVLRRESNGVDSRSWKVSFMGPSVDKKTYPFHHINSLKFLNDKSNDYKIMNIATAINTTGIFGTLNVVEANHTDYSEAANTSYYQVMRYVKPLTHKILPDGTEFNLEKSIKEIKKLMTQTVFSSNKDDNLFFEFDAGSVYYLSWDNMTDSTYYLNSVMLHEKVGKITSDSRNEHILLKFENTGGLKYIYRNPETSGFQYYDISKTNTLKSLPKKYREKEGLGYLIENIDGKM